MWRHNQPKHPEKTRSSSVTSSVQVKVEAEMATLLAHQNLLEKKAQEEQMRRQKERLQLEAGIVASMEKMSVFKTSVS